ncbi:MAG: DUF389 domain-containing protein [Flavobacteriales bacterium]
MSSDTPKKPTDQSSEEEKKAAEKAAKELELAKAKQEEEKKKLDYNFQSFLGSLKKYIKSLTSLKEGIDHEGTANGIRQDVEFRGHAAWILVCSILIACLGLNTNSPAVVIGAMLISPLMGPILGVGFAAGTNDGELLIKSLKNFGTTIFISLLISTLYFYITPLKDINDELVTRTSATIYAIAVAFTGGAAGIIAGSRSLKSNVVPGVAIATALMPPLCTAGYGLALGNWGYFIGAFYLFFINSVFIALPTYLYIRYLRFPVQQFVDPKRERKIKNYIFVFLVLVMVPSVYTFYNVIQQSIAERNITDYMKYVEAETARHGAYVLSPSHFNDGDSISCTMHLKGATLSEEIVDRIKGEAGNFNLSPDVINLVQDRDIESILSDFSNKQTSEMTQREQFVNALQVENQLLKERLGEIEKSNLLLSQVSEEIGSLYPEMTNRYLVKGVNDQVNLVYTWSEELEIEVIVQKEQSLKAWLPKRLEQDSVRFTSFN